MDPSKVFVYFGYAMSVVFVVLGVYMLFFFPKDLFVPEKDKFRIMFGVVLVIYGAYRFLSLRMKQRQDDEEQL